MATIQIKRRTSTGSGPLTGSSGTIRIGEPQVCFTAEKLYIAKSTKSGSSSAQLAASDYLTFPSEGVVNSAIDNKITELGLGTASKKNTGTSSGNIPILGTDGKLADSVIPKIALTNTFVVASQSAMLALSTAQEGDVAVRTDVNKSFILKNNTYSTLSSWQELLTPTDAVTSVNGKTGTVSITLSDLGGVSSTSFSAHEQTNTHLTESQRTILANAKSFAITSAYGSIYEANLNDFKNNTISDALNFSIELDSTYNPPKQIYSIGIAKGKVLTPSSVIDGGTY